ncbi:MAG: hypothetical protein ABIH92_02465 [Nanoarchaeota archaeon]
MKHVFESQYGLSDSSVVYGSNLDVPSLYSRKQGLADRIRGYALTNPSQKGFVFDSRTLAGLDEREKQRYLERAVLADNVRSLFEYGNLRTRQQLAYSGPTEAKGEGLAGAPAVSSMDLGSFSFQ